LLGKKTNVIFAPVRSLTEVKLNHTILSVAFLLMPVFILAQKPKVKNLPTHDDRLLHFGFTVGLNTMDFGIVHNEESDTLFADLYRLQPGFHVSMVSNLRLTKYLDLRFLPGISFGQRPIAFINNDFQSVEFSPQKINSSFVEFPLLLKYKAKRINNFRPYLIGGGNLRLDLAAKKDFDDEKDIYLRLKRFDFYYEIGFGFDSYLMFFKLSTEIKYSVGLRNVLLKGGTASTYPEYENAIDELYSHLIMLSFHFE